MCCVLAWVMPPVSCELHGTVMGTREGDTFMTTTFTVNKKDEIIPREHKFVLSLTSPNVFCNNHFEFYTVIKIINRQYSGKVKN